MNIFTNLMYFTARGLQCAAGDPLDDPYVGKPRSDLAIAVRNQGPIGIEWTSGDSMVRRQFSSDIQVSVDISNKRLLVIAHGCADLDSFVKPSNGIVLDAFGAMVSQIHSPQRILSQSNRDGSMIQPDGYSTIESVDGVIRIWISYWQGEWHELRTYDSLSTTWGPVIGHYRSR